MLLQLPAFVGPAGTGANKDGRKLNLAYTCQRLSDGRYLNAKSGTWAASPTLNPMVERGRSPNGDTNPTTGMLRGTYVGADAINFDAAADAVGTFQLVYHDRSRDNFVLGDQIYQSGLRGAGPITLTLDPVQPVRPQAMTGGTGKIPVVSNKPPTEI